MITDLIDSTPQQNNPCPYIHNPQQRFTHIMLDERLEKETRKIQGRMIRRALVIGRVLDQLPCQSLVAARLERLIRESWDDARCAVDPLSVPRSTNTQVVLSPVAALKVRLLIHPYHGDAPTLGHVIRQTASELGVRVNEGKCAAAFTHKAAQADVLAPQEIIFDGARWRWTGDVQVMKNFICQRLSC